MPFLLTLSLPLALRGSWCFLVGRVSARQEKLPGNAQGRVLFPFHADVEVWSSTEPPVLSCKSSVCHSARE